MRKLSSITVVLITICTIGAFVAIRPEAVSAPVGDEIANLVRRLASDEYAEREAAERGLAKMGHEAVGKLRTLEAQSDDAEVRVRLRRVIERITALRWHRDLQSACREAQASGKSVLVFSTIGEADGFS